MKCNSFFLELELKLQQYLPKVVTEKNLTICGFSNTGAYLECYIQLTKIPIKRTIGLRERLKRKHMKKAREQATINYHVVLFVLFWRSISFVRVRK